MKKRVTIIPEDNLIIIDDLHIVAKLDIPKDIRAIQWYEDSGHIEYTNKESKNRLLSVKDYHSVIEPLVKEAEKKKEVLLKEQEIEEKRNSIGEIGNTIKFYIREYLTNFVRQKDYDSIESLVSYSNSNNETYSIEAKHFIGVREQVWEKGYSIITEIELKIEKFKEEGNNIIDFVLPSKEEILSQLPTLSWDDIK